MDGIYDSDTSISLARTGEYKYSLIFFSNRGSFALGMLVYVKRKVYTETLPEGTKRIELEDMDNVVKGSARFYMGSDNLIVIEDNKGINRIKSELAIRGLIEKYAATNDTEFQPFTGKEPFSITFFRTEENSMLDFLNRVDNLTEVRATFKTFSNPFRNKKYEELAHDLLDTGAKTALLKNKEGMSQGSNVIQTIADMADDGHADVTMKGLDDSGEPVIGESNHKFDDVYSTKVIGPSADEFLEGIENILERLKKRRSG